MGKIFYVMGKSSSGKDTLFEELKKQEKLNLRTIVLYTTRPIREGENDGVQYHFTDEDGLLRLQEEGRVIELRAYDTVHGIWKYFTVDDGQIDLVHCDYLAIGTLESYRKLKEYFGEEKLIPLYIETEDGLRLERALTRERAQCSPKYAELCRRYLADLEDFSEERIREAGISQRFLNNGRLSDCLEELITCIRQRQKEEQR